MKSVLLPVDFIISKDAYANFSIPEFLMHRAKDKMSPETEDFYRLVTAPRASALSNVWVNIFFSLRTDF